MSLLVKALLLLWPFLRVAIFGNRKVTQVLLDNIHLVIITACGVMIVVMFMHMFFRYEEVKSENVGLKADLMLMCKAPKDTLLERRKALGDLLK